jgi:hypothetical protein
MWLCFLMNSFYRKTNNMRTNLLPTSRSKTAIMRKVLRRTFIGAFCIATAISALSSYIRPDNSSGFVPVVHKAVADATLTHKRVVSDAAVVRKSNTVSPGYSVSAPFQTNPAPTCGYNSVMYADPGLHTFVVPAGVTKVIITAVGAKGGDYSENGSSSFTVGGLGASIKGSFSVTPSETLNILVGAKGGNADISAQTPDYAAGGGGGGGSFVARNFTDTYPLVAAGGGGGAGKSNAAFYGNAYDPSFKNANIPNVNGAKVNYGNNGANSINQTDPFPASGDGGYNGSEGGGGDAAGGGAGWLNNGENDIKASQTLSFLGFQMQTGGISPRNTIDITSLPEYSFVGGIGGFGGGGSAVTGGGGGGGYSGGGGGGQYGDFDAAVNNPGSTNSYGLDGGGGGSYNGGLAGTTTNTPGVGNGDGYVKIEYYYIAPILNVTKTTFCAGETATYTDQCPDASHVWSSSNTAVATVSSSGVVTAVGAGTATIYLRQVTNSLVYAEQSVNITVNALPTVSPIGGTFTLNAGSNTTLTSSPSGGAWSSSNTAIATINSSTGLLNAVSAGTSTISYKVTNASGCSTTVTQVITVTSGSSPLVPGTIGSPQTICSGATPAALTSATAASGGTGTINYQWQSSTDNSNFSNISGATSATYAPGALTQTTYYRRGASTSTDAVQYTSSVAITVNALPTIGGTTTLCQSATSQLTGSGTPAVSNPWTSSNTSIATVSNTGFVTASSSNSGTTVITYTNSNGCTATVTVTVNAKPTIAVTPSTPIINNGGSASLTASGASTYSWSPSTGLSATSGASVTANPTSSTTYTVTGTDANGCVNTTTVTVRVIATALNFDGSNDYVQGPASTPQLDFGTSTDFTFETSVKFNGSQPNLAGIIAKGSSNNANNFVQLFIVNNKLAAEFMAGSTGTNFIGWGNGLLGTTNLNDGNWHHVAMTVSRATNTIKLYVDGNLEATVVNSIVGLNVTALDGAPLLIGTERNKNVFFNGTIDEVRVWRRALCQAELQNAKSCELSGTQNGLAAYYQLNAGYINFNNAGVITATDASGNGYNATLNNFALNGTTSNWVAGTVSGTCAAFNPTVAAITGNAPVCVGSTVQLSNVTNGGTWSSSNAAVATVSVSGLVTGVSAGTATISYTTDCGAVATVTVTVNAIVTPTFTQVAAICSGATLSALPTTSNNGITGTWSPALNNAATTTYTFTPNAGQCATTATMTITVNPNVTPTFTQVAAICSGATLSALPTTSNNGITGTWSPALNNTATTTYTFTPNAGQCATTATMTITVNPLPTVTVSPSAPVINNGGNVSLTASGASTYSWSPATGLSATTGATVTANPINTATYTVTGTNANGCVNITTVTVSVSQIPATALNFDGVDDKVTVSNTSIGNFGSGDFTVEMSVRTTLSNGVEYLVSKRNICGADNFFSLQIVNGTLNMEMGEPANYVALYGNTFISDGNWHHVALTRQSGNVNIYVDGALEATSNATIANINNSYALEFGSSVCNGQNGSVKFKGDMDEIRIWNRALCTAELGYYRTCELSTPQTGLQAYYKLNAGYLNFNNAGVTTAADASGNGNNATLSNFALTGTSSNWVSGIVSGNCTPYIATQQPITGNTSVCVGGTTQLANASAGGTWSSSNTAVAFVNAFGLVTGIATGTATITYANLCGGVSTVTVTVNAIPGTPSVIVVDNCNGTSTLSTIAGGSLLWSTGETTSTITVNAAGTYTVTKTVNGCTSAAGSGVAAPKTTPAKPVVTVVDYCNGTSVLSTNATGSLLWSTGETTSSITVNSSGTFTVTTTVNGCISAAASATASPRTTPATPVVTVVNNCDGTSTLSTNASGILQWNNHAGTSSITVNSAGTYTVTTTVNGCVSAPGSGVAAPKTTPVATISAVGGTTACPGNTVVLQSNSTADTYQWYNNGNLIAGANAATYAASTSGSYTLIVSSNGCTSAASNAIGVVIEDVTAPAAPMLSTLNGQCSVTVPVPAANDNCSGTVTGTTSDPLTYTVQGEYDVHWTFTDASGNSSYTTQHVSVKDVTPPVINDCPSNISVFATSPSGAVVNYTAPTASDNCSVVINRTAGLASGSLFPLGTTTITYTATDAGGNIATCTFTVTVGGVPPVISCPANIVVNATAGQCGTNVTFSASESTAVPVSVITYTENGNPVTPGSFFSVGIHTIVATATNSVGTSTCSFTIKVNDAEPPVLVGVPADATVSCASVPAAATVTATDNCSGVSAVSFTQTIVNQVNPGNYQIKRTWTVTDAAGNTTTQTQTITVQDNTAPLITCPANIIVNATNTINGDGAFVTFAATATDNCGIPVLSYSIVSGSFFAIGTTTVTVTADDGNGNTSQCSFDVIVKCVAPVITGKPSSQVLNTTAGRCDAPASYTVTASGIPASSLSYAFTGATTGSGTGTGSGSLFNTGVTTITVTAFNQCGTDSYSFTVTVKDEEKPTITAPAAVIVSTDLNQCTASNVSLGSALTGDNCGIQSVVNDAPAVFPIGTTTVTWTVTDVNGNTNTATQTVTVKDTQKPVVTCPGTITVDATGTVSGIDGAYVNYTATATDNCGTPVVTYSIAPGTYFAIGTTNVTVTATDAAGNQSTCTITVIVKCVPPVITSKPVSQVLNTTAGRCDAPATYSVTASGIPASSLSYAFTGATTGSGTGTGTGSLFNKGVTTVTVTASNQCGSDSYSFTVTVEDHENPVITAPADVVKNVDPNSCTAVVNLGNPVVSDNCPGTVVTRVPAGNTFNTGETIITWTVTDASGNVATTTQKVTVIDNIAPVIVNCPGTITVDAETGKCSAKVSFELEALPPVIDQQYTDIYIGTAGQDQWQSFTAGKTGKLTQIDLYRNGIQPINNAVLSVYQGVGVSGTLLYSGTFNYGSGNNWTAFPIPSASQPNVTAGQVYTIRIQSTSSIVPGQGLFLLGGSPSLNPGTYYSSSYGLNPGWKLDYRTYVSTPGSTINATDNCGLQSFTSNYNSGDVFPVGTTHVVFTAVDLSGNTSSCSFDVVVKDAQPPVLVGVPADATVPCSAVPSAPVVTATDNCTANLTVGFNETVVNQVNPGNYQIKRTWTVTDAAGNTTTQTQTITVQDNTAPVITCPQNISVVATTIQSGTGGTYVTYTASATDNCGLAPVSYSIQPGSFFPIGTTVVTVTSNDGNGNTGTCSFTVTVTCVEPVITDKPASQVLNTTAGRCDAPAAYSVTATGIPASSLTYTFTGATTGSGAGTGSGSIFNKGVTSVTVTASNLCGSDSYTFTITVEDHEAPVIINTPAPVSKSNDAGQCGAIVNWIVPGVTDNCPGFVLVADHNPGEFFPVGTTTVHYTATDASGNTATSSFTITVTDDENPIITVPADVTHTADAGKCSFTFATTGNTTTVNSGNPGSGNGSGNGNNNTLLFATATANDNCGIVTVAGVRSDAQPLDAAYPVGVTTIVWTATDSHGHTTTGTQTVTIIDEEAPVIVAPANVTVDADQGSCSALASGVVLGTPQTSDNCAVQSVTNNAPASFATGTTSVIWTVVDIHGNSATAIQTVTVVDNQKPTFTCPANITIAGNAGSNGAVVSSYTVTDAADNCGVASVTYSVNPGSFFAMGTTTPVTITVKDINGNEQTCTITVTIINTPPFANPDVKNTPEDTPVSGNILTNDTDFDGQGLTVTGFEINGTPYTTGTLVNIPGVGTLIIGSNGDYTFTPAPNYNGPVPVITYSITDGNGGTATSTLTIVVDPVNDLPVAANDAVTTDEDTPVSGSVTGNDVLSGDGGNTWSLVSGPLHGTLVFNADGTYTYTPAANYHGTDAFTYQLCDADGDCSPATVFITVNPVDDAPYIKAKDKTVYVDQTGHVTITVGDIDDGSYDPDGVASLTIDKTSFDCSQLGPNTVTLTLVDVDGHVATATATVTVLDIIKPVITCPAPVTVQCASAVPAPNVAQATASDNCSAVITWDGDVIVNQTAPHKYTIQRTYRATDPSGNYSTCVQLITVNDTQAPVLTGVLPGATGLQCVAGVPAAPATSAIAAQYTDNCSGVVSAVYTSSTTTGDNTNGWTVKYFYTVSDVSGNSTTACVTYTGKDNTKPTVSCPQDITVTASAVLSGQSGAYVTLTGATAADNCSTPVITYSPASGSFFPVGTTEVTVTATDAAGNSSTCKFRVTVNCSNPVITVSSVPASNVYTGGTSTSLFLGYGAQSTTLKVTTASAGAYTYVWTGADLTMLSNTNSGSPVFTPTRAGSYTFVVTVTNAVGCKSTSSITICVTDIRVPSKYGYGNDDNDDDDDQTMCDHKEHDSKDCSHKGHNHKYCDHKAHSKYDCEHKSKYDKYKEDCDHKAHDAKYCSHKGHNHKYCDHKAHTKYDCNNRDDGDEQKECDHKSHDSKDCTHKGHNHKYCDHKAHSKYDCDHDRSKGSDEKVCDHKAHYSQDCTHNGHNHGSCNHKAHDAKYCYHSGCDDQHNDDDDDEGDDDKDSKYQKVYLCHYDAKYGTYKTLELKASYVAKYLTQYPNDRLGSCDQQPCTGYTDRISPVISCPGDTYISCGTSPSPSVTGKATATDNVEGTITITYSDATVNNIITRTWKATDAAGNFSTCTQTIRIKDDVKPVLTDPADITVSCGTSTAPAVTGFATATDNCSTPVVTYTDAVNGNEIKRTWKAVDAAGNYTTAYQIITIVDNVKPVITDPADITVSCGASTLPAATGTATATDNCSTPVITYSDVVNGNIITRTWKATDAAGNFSTAVQVITQSVPFTTTITSTPNSNVNTGGVTTNLYIGYGAQSTTLTVGGVLPSSGAPYTYSWSGNGINSCNASQGSSIVFTPTTGGSYTFTATTTNKNGCAFRQTITICVKDIRERDRYGVLTNSGKVYVCHLPPGNIANVQTICISVNAVPAHVPLHGGDMLGSCDQTCGDITPNRPPVITVPRDVTVSCVNDVTTTKCGTATGIDKDGRAATISYTDEVNGNVITRTWKAADASGNYTLDTQTITVIDNVKPVINDPADITVNCGASTLPSATGTATATDNCTTPVVTYSDVTNGNVITRTWKATDASGNFSTAVQYITIGVPFTVTVSSVPTSSTYTGGNPNNLYLGYGAQSTTLQLCSLPSSGAPYTYSWNGGSNTNRLSSTTAASPVFTPATFGYYTFTVTVTNKFGCTSTASVSICVTDIRVPGTNGTKVYVCHTPTGKYAVPQTLQVLVSQVSSHIGTGYNYCGSTGYDRLGSCDQTPCVNTTVTSVEKGIGTTATKEGSAVEASTSEEDLKVTVMPNPSTTFFTLKLESKYETPVNIRVMDGRGRVVDARTKVGANSTLQIGHNYSSGTYYAELIQGNTRKVVQLIKGRG